MVWYILQKEEERKQDVMWGDISQFRSVPIASGGFHDQSGKIVRFNGFPTFKSSECCPIGRRAYYEIEVLDEMRHPQFGFASANFEVRK